jgi:hypothetical protein
MHPQYEKISEVMCLTPFGLMMMLCLMFWLGMCVRELEKCGFIGWPNCVGLLILCMVFETILCAIGVWTMCASHEQKEVFTQLGMVAGGILAALLFSIVPWFLLGLLMGYSVRSMVYDDL